MLETAKTGVALLLLIPALLLVIAVIASPSDYLGYSIFAVLLLVTAMAYGNGHAYVSADDSYIKVGLFPLLFKKLPLEQIQEIAFEKLAPEAQISREWGNKGKFSGKGGLLLDCGPSNYAVRFTLRDRRSYAIGLGSEITAAHEAFEHIKEHLPECM